MIDKTGFGTKYKPLAERRDQLDNQMPELQAEIDVYKISRFSQEVAIEEARDLHSRWPTLSNKEKRSIVEAIVERIVIGDGEVFPCITHRRLHLPVVTATPQQIKEDTTSAGNRGKKATNPQGRVHGGVACRYTRNHEIAQRFNSEAVTSVTFI